PSSTMAWSSGLPFSRVERFFAWDSMGYGQYRTLYGYTIERGRRFVPLRRNTERNSASLNINLRAQKAFVLGRLASKVFLSVDNLLNSDDLRIYSQEGGAAARTLTTLNSERRFGRRFAE